MRFPAALILAIVISAPARADLAALPQPSRATLETRATAMSMALVNRDAAAGFDMLPPPLIAQMAALLGQSPDGFRALFIDNMENNRPGTGVMAHRLDLEKAELFTGSDGVGYALIPTESEAFDPTRGPFRVQGTTVAIPSGDTWHFFTISDPGALSVLIAAYPALADAPLVPVTLTPLP